MCHVKTVDFQESSNEPVVKMIHLLRLYILYRLEKIESDQLKNADKLSIGNLHPRCTNTSESEDEAVWYGSALSSRRPEKYGQHRLLRQI